MAPTQPTPATWAIRFRHHRTTVLLPVDPLQSIASIKADLFAALQQTTPTGRLSDATPLPDSAEDILLAKPVDTNDPAAGWVGLSAKKGGPTLPAKSKGKGKVGADASGADAESLKSLGIKDNALLAFKFASASPSAAVQVGKQGQPDGGAPEQDGEGDELAGMDIDGEGEVAEVWDVVMPAWEDQYGVTNTGDAGALKEFTG